jgi:hypothetical protein
VEKCAAKYAQRCGEHRKNYTQSVQCDGQDIGHEHMGATTLG